MSRQIPITLRRIFEIYFLVQKFDISRMEAIKRIAKEDKIAPQTITSVCMKRLNITTKDFDEFLQKKNQAKFKKLLLENFPFYTEQIETLLQEISGGASGGKDDSVVVIKTLFPDENKFLIASLILKEIRTKFQEWDKRSDIPDNISEQLNRWINKIDENI